METKFQTSFIPKKPLTQASSAPVERRPTSVLSLIGIFVFVISILLAGGAYGWQAFLQSEQTQYAKDLTVLKNSFNIGLIVQLKQTATKIDMASRLLSSHVAFSQIFGVLSSMTASNIRFTSFDLGVAAGNKGVKVSMNGYAPSYDALAFQSDQLSHLEDLGIRNIIMSPVITNPTQNPNSTVSFQLSADINPASMLYRNLYTAPSGAGATGAAASTTSPAANANSGTITP